MENIETLLGPIGLARVKSDKYDKDIYLIGDVHIDGRMGESDKDMDFEKYLSKYFIRNKDTQFDYFIEGELDCYGKYLFEGCPLYSAYNFFRDVGCFSLNKLSQKKCQIAYPNVRFHVVDIRRPGKYYKVEPQKNIIEVFITLAKITNVFTVKNLNKKEALEYFNEDMNESSEGIINMLRSISTLSKFKKMFKDGFKTKKITSQLEDCSVADRKIIKKIIKDTILRANTYLDEIEEKYGFFTYIKKLIKLFKSKKLSKKDFNYLINDPYNIYIFFVKLNSVYLDVYYIARLFKKFDDKKHKYTKKSFIHAGAAHTIRIQNFLEKYFGFEILEEMGATDDKFWNKKELETADIGDYQLVTPKLPFFQD